MSFSEALTLIIHGHHLRRAVWTNRGAHVRRVTEQVGGSPPANYFGYFDENAVIRGREHNEWTPKWEDMTAIDWAVLPD